MIAVRVLVDKEFVLGWVPNEYDSLLDSLQLHAGIIVLGRHREGQDLKRYQPSVKGRPVIIGPQEWVLIVISSEGMRM